MRTKKTEPGRLAFNIIACTIISLLVVAGVLPFVMIISGSLSNTQAIMKNGYSLFIQDFTVDAYRMIFRFPEEIGKSYLVSIFVTVVGTVFGLFIMTMAGYVLQRRDLRYSNQIAFFFYFTTLFSGGLVPWYMMISKMGMKETVWSLIIPMMCSPFNILLIRNFMKQIPESLTESAQIDGAGDFYIFSKIIAPLSKPILATVGLFLALAYWNNWYLASLFVNDVNLWPLQYRLHRILTAAMAVAQGGAENFVNASLPTETVKLANAVIATGPIILLYPFLQKYFVQGITIGAVKG